MKNGNYTITNPKTNSTLHIQLTDADGTSVVQRDASGNHTGQQSRTRAEAVVAIERAEAAGMTVNLEPLGE